MMDDENIVSVILRDTSGLVLGDSYRFCLVLLHERHIKREMVVGCSNQTRLQAIEATGMDAVAGGAYDDDDDRARLQQLYTEPEIATDYGGNGIHRARNVTQQRLAAAAMAAPAAGQTILVNNHIVGADDGMQRLELFGQLNRSFLPGLAMGILIAGLLALIWGIVRLRMQQMALPCGAAMRSSAVGGATATATAVGSTTGTTCYAAASSLRIPGALDAGTGGGGGDSHNRYLKLQATTSL